MTGACWAPLVVAGLGEAAVGESRGWRPAAGFHGSGVGSVEARHSSPGLYPSDMASVVFHWLGNVPLEHFAAIAAGPGAEEFALGVLDDPGIGEAVQGWT